MAGGVAAAALTDDVADPPALLVTLTVGAGFGLLLFPQADSAMAATSAVTSAVAADR
jgi:hypothetical protein